MTPEEQDATIQRIRKKLEGRPVTVLLVEDNEFDATLTLQTLESVGVKANWAKNGAEVEEYLAANSPSLTFLDLNLGTAERGLNVLSTIRSSKPDCHVVVLTGVFDIDAAECQKALEMDAVVIKKPLRFEHAQLLFSTP